MILIDTGTALVAETARRPDRAPDLADGTALRTYCKATPTRPSRIGTWYAAGRQHPGPGHGQLLVARPEPWLQQHPQA